VVERKQNILIVEDDVDVAGMLDAYFRVQGYKVTTVNWGEDAIESCRKNRPDLIILDIRLPDIDGYEVAKRLRDTRRTEDVPIIFLTEKRGRQDILQGLELGAEDYITKPFDIQELRLRVKNALQRLSQGAINNPVTGLPEGALVDERLAECLGTKDWAIILVNLENFIGFRESYGFVVSDDVIRAVSLIVKNAVRNFGNLADFIGHISPNDFVVVSQPNTAIAIQEWITTRLEQYLDYFYPLEDRDKNPEKLRNKLAYRLNILIPTKAPYKNIAVLKKALFKF
jgi:PleD family two-component response regulator